MHEYWVEFGKVALAHLLAVASPGPDFAIVVKQSLTHGRRTAIWTSIGIGTGILLHITYCLLGIGLLITSSVFWFTIVKYLGAAYLAWLGIQALRTKPRHANTAGLTHVHATPRPHGAFATGFLTNVLGNPKAALFFLALFTVVIDPHTPRLIQAGYGLWMSVATAAWFTFVSFTFTQERVRAAFLRQGHWIDRGLGVVFLAFAASLAFAALKS
jgi:RhtB (resistance to homoserine/threonine) family protein